MAPADVTDWLAVPPVAGGIDAVGVELVHDGMIELLSGVSSAARVECVVADVAADVATECTGDCVAAGPVERGGLEGGTGFG